MEEEQKQFEIESWAEMEPDEDREFDPYEIAIGFLADASQMTTTRRDDLCARVFSVIDELERKCPVVEKSLPDVIELHAIYVDSQRVIVREEIMDMKTHEMTMLDDNGYSLVVHCMGQPERTLHVKNESVEKLEQRTAPAWYFETRTGTYTDRREYQGIGKKIPWTPFVDLSWHTPVHMKVGKQVYKIHMDKCERNDEAIALRIASPERSSSRSFLITSRISERPHDTQVTFVSGNAVKIRDFLRIVNFHDVGYFRVVPSSIIEIQGTPHQIIRDKASKAYAQVGSRVIVEDTSLYIDALDGCPGPYVKDWVKKKTMRDMDLFVDNLSIRSARFYTLYCYYDGDPQNTKLTKIKIKGEMRPRRRKAVAKSEWTVDEWFWPHGSKEPMGDMDERTRMLYREPALLNLFAQVEIGKLNRIIKLPKYSNSTSSGEGERRMRPRPPRGRKH